MRLSKEGFLTFLYILHMNEDIEIQSHWTVDETLKHKSKAIKIFNQYQTHCVGCYMQKFCTLKDVTEIYRIDLGEFLKNLNNHKKGE